MGKKVIISNKQYKMLKEHVNESYQQNLVEKIISDLETNYKKVLETFEDRVAGDFKQRKGFEVNVTGDIINPISLRDYMCKKYQVGERFMEQVLNDWCDNKINDGFLSKDISTKEWVVDIRDKIRGVLKEVYGGFETYLETEYEKYITENLSNGSYNTKREWLTYNQVILELKHNIKDTLKVKELQYKLTENDKPSQVCIEVIETLEVKTPELERLYYKIRNF